MNTNQSWPEHVARCNGAGPQGLSIDPREIVIVVGIAVMIELEKTGLWIGPLDATDAPFDEKKREGQISMRREPFSPVPFYVVVFYQYLQKIMSNVKTYAHLQIN